MIETRNPSPYNTDFIVFCKFLFNYRMIQVRSSGPCFCYFYASMAVLLRSSRRYRRLFSICSRTHSSCLRYINSFSWSMFYTEAKKSDFSTRTIYLRQSKRPKGMKTSFQKRNATKGLKASQNATRLRSFVRLCDVLKRVGTSFCKNCVTDYRKALIPLAGHLWSERERALYHEESPGKVDPAAGTGLTVRQETNKTGYKCLRGSGWMWGIVRSTWQNDEDN